MATKTIDYLEKMVTIAHYEHEGFEYDALHLSVMHRKGVGFFVSYQPVKRNGFGGFETGPMPSDDPLVGGKTLLAENADKNNAKRLQQMMANLEAGTEAVVWLFDHREWDKLNIAIVRLVRDGYTEKYRQQMHGLMAETNENLKSQISNLKIQKNTTMAQNVKAADLIGKVIIVGNNQGTIVIKSVQDNGMLACEFSKAGDTATTPLTVTMPNLQKMTERGLWKMESRGQESGGQVRDSMQNQATCPPDSCPPDSDVTTEADVAEVQDIVPVVTKRTNNREPITNNQPAAKVEPIGKPKQEKPKAKTQPSAVKHQPFSKAASEREQNGARTSSAEREQARGDSRKYVYSTYQTSKGKTGAKITGVSETDAAYQQAAAIHASGSYERDKDGNKHFYLCFGPRYAEAAKKVCELLNAGKPIEDAIAVVNAATEERAVKREEWKQKREERKAQPSKDYSREDVAEMLRKVLAGGDVPEDIKAILAKAA